MAAEWRTLCKGARDFCIDDDVIEVQFAEGRRHRLSVEDEGEAIRVYGFVAKSSVTSTISDLALQIWRRNRAAALAGFRRDARGRLLGEVIVPKAGITPDEFQTWVRIVAAECDRLEHVLTGKDIE